MSGTIKNNNLNSYYTIPDEKIHHKLLFHTKNYIREKKLVSPLSPSVVFQSAEKILKNNQLPLQYKKYTSVLVGRLVWEEILGSIPFERRILLLPLCLRNLTNCEADLDEFGLICLQCGNCDLGKIQKRAEELGYMVLIAEGTTVVTKLIERGQAEAVIGVGCLSSLERSFPYITKAAIPAIAIPLQKDNCIDTVVDTDWLLKTIEKRNTSDTHITFDYKKLRKEIESWFSEDNLNHMIKTKKTSTEQIALNWLGSGGKRWRPFLTVSTYQAISNEFIQISEGLKKLAISVECFHKASLIHDDIEDDDNIRYDNLALHKQHNIPIAINIGDLLIGFGYKLIAETNLSPEIKDRLFTEIAQAHTNLCIGQGEELKWLNQNFDLTTNKVIEIFRKKTSPAFEVAMTIGAIAAQCSATEYETLVNYSNALGISYQIQDDIQDYGQQKNEKNLIFSIMNSFNLSSEEEKKNKALELLEFYENQALDSISGLDNICLKSHLFRLIYKILSAGINEI